MIQFLLHDKYQVIKHYEPSLSVLEYLRLEKNQTGTKEGCAAGDCGACTVVIGEVKKGKLHYHAVNACITPLASLQGKQLITVENLAEQGILHPVQESMVNCHGSQCGFCTPGIVMSLFAWWQSIKSGELQASYENIEQALSGNLCRCTGYQPIINAAWESINSDITEQFRQQQSVAIERLQKIRSDHGVDMIGSDNNGQSLKTLESEKTAKGSTMIPTGFVSPLNLAEMVEYRAKFPDAILVAGATDLGLRFTQELGVPGMLIYTGQVAEMKNVERLGTSLLVGAAVTYSEMHGVINELYPAFGNLLYRLGSLQVRNQGTLGGNIANASPIGDTPPVVLALDGLIHLHSIEGRRVVNANDFFKAYRQTAMRKDECIVAVELPLLKERDELKVYKVSKRFDDDISAICIGIWIQFDHQSSVDNLIKNIRIACGGMAATPVRAIQTEQALIGQPFDQGSMELVQEGLQKDFHPIDDVRASAAYRLAVASKLLLRAMLEIDGKQMVDMFDDQLKGKVVTNA